MHKLQTFDQVHSLRRFHDGNGSCGGLILNLRNRDTTLDGFDDGIIPIGLVANLWSARTVEYIRNAVLAFHIKIHVVDALDRLLGLLSDSWLRLIIRL